MPADPEAPGDATPGAAEGPRCVDPSAATACGQPRGATSGARASTAKIAAPERIVCTDSFADEHGNPVPPTYYGMSPSWPAETLVTVTFDEQGGATRLTARHDGLASASAAERDLISAGLGGIPGAARRIPRNGESRAVSAVGVPFR